MYKKLNLITNKIEIVKHISNYDKRLDDAISIVNKCQAVR